MLDRSRTRRGQDHATAIQDTVRFARQAEQLGYHRFWVSEHHSVPGVAGSAPTVLAAAVAAATSRIRVGTGGVMLPNHRPIVVAEQFGVLEALHPGRIDMGLGRSVGFTGGVRRALGSGKDDAEDFPAQLAELLDYLKTGRDGVHAWPTEGMRIPPFILAMKSGGDIAADFGLPMVTASAGDEETMLTAIDRYRERFRPSEWLSEPYVVVSGTVAVAETREAARRLLVSEAWSTAYSRTHGAFPPLEPAEEILAKDMTAKERALFEAAMRGQIHGTEDEVAAALDRLIQRSGADEILVHTSTFDRADMLDSHRRLAALAGLTPRLRAAG